MGDDTHAPDTAPVCTDPDAPHTDLDADVTGEEARETGVLSARDA